MYLKVVTFHTFTLVSNLKVFFKKKTKPKPNKGAALETRNFCLSKHARLSNAGKQKGEFKQWGTPSFLLLVYIYGV